MKARPRLMLGFAFVGLSLALAWEIYKLGNFIPLIPLVEAVLSMVIGLYLWATAPLPKV